jgi:hypothetical protein
MDDILEWWLGEEVEEVGEKEKKRKIKIIL